MADSNSRLFSQGYNGPDCVKQHQQSNSNAVAIPMTTELRFQSAQLDFSPTIACTTYPYNDPYFSGVLTSYPPPAMVHPNMLGMQHARMPLPLEMTEEPVYVNAKQYHGILRRRQLRAKAESENKLLKTRKPYLHESRHLHAMKRARGCGGRFLNTKKLDEAKESAENRKMSDTNASTGSSSGSEVIQSDVNVRKDMQRICDKSGLEVSSAVESRKNETNYSFSQSNEPYSNLYHNSHFHISAFHPLQSRNEEGNSGQNGGMFSGGSQHRAVVIQ